jgi:hypothetical protein
MKLKPERMKRNISRKIYQKTDYESNNGMLVSIWGPSAWHFLHTISFNYPVHPTKKNKKEYRNYVLNLVNVLPCGKCRKNLRENFIKLPLQMINMENRDTFSRYIYDLHELVNHMLGKESGLTYEQVKERYEHFRARCSVSKGEMIPKIRNYTRKNESKTKMEKGCTEPLVGEKAKCILKIVPEKNKCKTFSIDKKCVKRRKTMKNTNP